MNTTWKSILLAGACALTLGACASHGQVRGTTTSGYYSSGTTGSGSLYYYQSRPIYQPYYRYRAYPSHRIPRSYQRNHNLRDFHRNYRHRSQHGNWRNYNDRRRAEPGQRPDRNRVTPPVRRPGVTAPIRVDPIDRRRVD